MFRAFVGPDGLAVIGNIVDSNASIEANFAIARVRAVCRVGSSGITSMKETHESSPSATKAQPNALHSSTVLRH